MDVYVGIFVDRRRLRAVVVECRACAARQAVERRRKNHGEPRPSLLRILSVARAGSVCRRSPASPRLRAADVSEFADHVPGYRWDRVLHHLARRTAFPAVARPLVSIARQLAVAWALQSNK